MLSGKLIFLNCINIRKKKMCISLEQVRFLAHKKKDVVKRETSRRFFKFSQTYITGFLQIKIQTFPDQDFQTLKTYLLILKIENNIANNECKTDNYIVVKTWEIQ